MKASPRCSSGNRVISLSPKLGDMLCFIYDRQWINFGAFNYRNVVIKAEELNGKNGLFYRIGCMERISD